MTAKTRLAPRIPMRRVHPRVIVLRAGHEIDRPESVWANHEAARTGADLVVLPDGSAGVVQAALQEDTIVIGTGGGGVLRHLLRDDVPHPVLSAARCVVVVVPSRWRVPAAGSPAPVAVGYAADVAGRAALDWAVHRAEATGADLDVVQAVVPLPGEHALRIHDESLWHACDVLGEDRVRVRHVNATVEGAAAAITERTRRAEILVVGNHHANLWSALTGWSVAESVALRPTCPVALIPAVEVEP